jgi:hypothetical protein
LTIQNIYREWSDVLGDQAVNLGPASYEKRLQVIRNQQVEDILNLHFEGEM